MKNDVINQLVPLMWLLCESFRLFSRLELKTRVVKQDSAKKLVCKIEVGLKMTSFGDFRDRVRGAQ